MKVTDAVLAGITEAWGFSAEQIRGGCRIRNLVTARHVAMYALRQAGLSYPAIARELGGRDHTTVMHGVAKIERFMATTAISHPMRLVIVDLVADGQEALVPVAVNL